MKLSKFLFTVSLFLIFILSVIPVQDLPPTNDKLNHIAAFFYLAVLGVFSRFDRFRLFFILLFYGAFIEFVQLFVPGRSCDWRDLIADVVGIFFGFLFLSIFFTFKRRKNET